MQRGTTERKESIAMDREKVMSWLEGLAQDDWNQFHSDSEVSNIAKSALALLKEQEQKTGKWLPCKASIYPYGYDVKCSECGLQMGSTFGYHYCPKCGAKMEE